MDRESNADAMLQGRVRSASQLKRSELGLPTSWDLMQLDGDLVLPERLAASRCPAHVRRTSWMAQGA